MQSWQPSISMANVKRHSLFWAIITPLAHIYKAYKDRVCAPETPQPKGLNLQLPLTWIAPLKPTGLEQGLCKKELQNPAQSQLRHLQQLTRTSASGDCKEGNRVQGFVQTCQLALGARWRRRGVGLQAQGLVPEKQRCQKCDKHDGSHGKI